MQMFVYIVLASVIYAVLAQRTDEAVDREMKKRRADNTDLTLVEDLDVRPNLAPRFGRMFNRHEMSDRRSVRWRH